MTVSYSEKMKNEIKHYEKEIDLNRDTPQLCCGWDKTSINFNRKYI